MRKLQLTSRRVLATLMAVVLLAVLIPTVLTDKAMAADYVERDGEYYFWTEGGLRQLITDCPWGGIVHLVRDREGWRYDGTELIFTEDLTIPEAFHVKLGSADVSVAEGKTLTVEGTLELDAGNSVQGPGSLVYDNGTYIKTRDAGTLEEMNTALADAASAAESDGASGSVSITNNITADGDYTLTAGAMLQVETGYVLTVGGTLTVPAGAVLVNNGGVVCEAMVIADGGVVRNNSDAEIVKRDEANVGLYYGDKLTINGALYNKGTIGCGYRSSTMIEVGATNKTHLRDYERAIGEQTRALLKVHTSNYRIVGFAESVPLEDMAALGRKYDLPVIQDIGSGSLVELEQFGIRDEPTVQKSIRAGVDVVSFSGDKLLGGPQAGIIIGKREYIERFKRHPLARAMRVDKMTLAALNATLHAYLDGAEAVREIPTLAMLAADESTLHAKAALLQKVLADAGVGADLVAADDQVGGGSVPTQLLPAWAVMSSISSSVR